MVRISKVTSKSDSCYKCYKRFLQGENKYCLVVGNTVIDLCKECMLELGEEISQLDIIYEQKNVKR